MSLIMSTLADELRRKTVSFDDDVQFESYKTKALTQMHKSAELGSYEACIVCPLPGYKFSKLKHLLEEYFKPQGITVTSEGCYLGFSWK